MKNKAITLLVLLAMLTSGLVLKAQEKYAILISGDRPDYEYQAQGDCDVPDPLPPEWEMWKASWNDTYLMWEMLVYEKGYDNDNVFVLWADGIDWSLNPLYPGAGRYDAQQMHPDEFPYSDDQFTDYAATLINVQNVFQNLANGTGGLPQITEDDFLFIWLYGRNGGSCTEDRTVELYNEDFLLDYDFKQLTDLITANKKVIIVDSWFAGCFENEYEDDEDTYWLGSSSYINAEILADDECLYYPNELVVENEEWGLIKYYHGELDFHMLSCLKGEAPNGDSNYGTLHSWDIDFNNDNNVRFSEFSQYRSWV